MHKIKANVQVLTLLCVRQGSYSERLYRAAEGSGLQGVNHAVLRLVVGKKG